MNYLLRPAMDWGSLFAIIYLLGVLFTAVVTTNPVRAVMGADRAGEHGDAESSADARMIVIFVVTGVAAIWPITLPVYILSRIIPASSADDTDTHGVELVLAQRYGQPE